jgi:two-component system alkaline phosphatase synthesis response regulator PhoP
VSGQRKHILVVEDEEHLAIGIAYNLEAEGYRATTVGDGPAAVEHLRKADSDIDLVILDLMLPGMSGYAVLETLRSEGADLPVLILSARTLTEDRTRGFDVGADQYLTKPFDLDELLARVKNLLAMYALRKQRLEQPRPGVEMHRYRFGEACIDFDSHEATCRGKKAKLTKLERGLLKYFIENEGRVIPREELLENVWEMPGHINTRAPDQFLLRLRKLFEADSANPRHFLTLRDSGYRFVANPPSDE